MTPRMDWRELSAALGHQPVPRLRPELIQQARRMTAQGLSDEAIAGEVKLTPRTVKALKRGAA